MYHAKAEAKKAVAEFLDYDEYLDSLNMTATIDDFKDINISRIAQLTNKSNQFNLTTLRCSEDDIKAMQSSNDYVCLCGKLEDKFADNGIVSVVVGQIIDNDLHIRLWLMSCRVLKRGLEDAMMNEIFKVARKIYIKRIVGYYYPTMKNAMVKNFFRDMGFRCTQKDELGNIQWCMAVDEYEDRELHMTVVEMLPCDILTRCD